LNVVKVVWAQVLAAVSRDGERVSLCRHWEEINVRQTSQHAILLYTHTHTHPTAHLKVSHYSINDWLRFWQQLAMTACASLYQH